MDFKQLEAFAKVIEMKSFSRAAEAMYLSQASISLYINALERELNSQLIVRSSKNFMPTKSGATFYEYVKNMFALKEKVLFDIHTQTNSIQGEITIFTSSVPAQYFLPEILVDFHKQYPNISFKIIQKDTKEVTEAISTQQCELGIVGAKMDPIKCRFEHIFSDPLIMIAPPFANYNRVSIEELPDFIYHENFILREAGSGTRHGYETFMKKNGVDFEKLNVIASFSNTQSILQAVSKGLGISIVSKLAAEEYLHKQLIQTIDISIPMPMRDFYFATKKNTTLSPVGKVFVDAVHAHFR